ncbi:MAG: hypothetical protein Q4A21_03170 [bacterium]|nr:hypothetical protein [bacterium]
MNKIIKKIISLAVICATVFVHLSNIAAASGSSQFFISRVNATNGAEFIEIFNSGSDAEISKISISQGAGNKEIFSTENIIFQGGSHILIRQSGSGLADGYFDGNNISEKAILKLNINDKLTNFICAESGAQCQKAGLSKNSTDIKGNKIAVNIFSLGMEKKKYDFELIDSSEPISTPNMGGIIEKTTPQISPTTPTPPIDSTEESTPPSATPPIDGNKEDKDPQNPVTPPKDDKTGDNPDTEDSTQNNPSQDNEKENQDSCLALQFTELLINSADGFFEIQNKSDHKINLENCKIAYKNTKKPFDLPDKILKSGEYFALKFSETNLKPAKTTAGEFFLLDESGAEIESIKYDKQKPEVPYAKFDSGWKNVKTSTFSAENIEEIEQTCQEGYYFDNNSNKCQKQKFIDKEEKPCEIGYFRNPETGRCKKLETPKTEVDCQIGYERNPETNRCRKIQNLTATLTPCNPGYYRSEETGRCRKIATLSSSRVATQTPCREGYYRSPETNRCRKIATTSTKEPAPCKEGYERNPETNRCRKIVKNLSATDTVENAVENSKKFSGWWAIILVILAIIGILIGDFRATIGRFFSKFKKN